MIYLYSGTPGSGKSLHQAKDIYQRLQKDRLVIANFQIDISKIKGCRGTFMYLDNSELTPENLIKIATLYFKDHQFKEGALRVYIDECQLLFNARDWSIRGRKEWLSFFTQHRKYGFDIFLVAQFDRMVDRQIRSLIEYEVIHRKVSNFGNFGFVLGMLCGGNLFVAITMWYPMHERISSNWFAARKKFYSIYNTFNTFEEFKDSDLKKLKSSVDVDK